MSDDDGFARTVLPHLDAAWRLARWLVREPAAAEDVVQDSLVRALTYFASFRGGDGRAWLLRIVRNTAVNRSSSLARRAEDQLDTTESGAHANLVDLAASPEAVLQQTEAHATLAERVAALPTGLREAIVLREFEEMSYRDIAAITGVPMGTVMSRLWQARQILLERPAPPAGGKTAKDKTA